MAEHNITVQFDERIAKFIEFYATQVGFENAKDFIEAIILHRIFDALERANPTIIKH